MPCRIPAVAAVRCAASMEGSSKAFVHYHHDDSSAAARWTVRESYRYMYGRSWNKVSHFYSQLVPSGGGKSSLAASLFSATQQEHGPQENFIDESDSVSVTNNDNTRSRSGRWARMTFKIIVSYHGGSFDGWQKQPGLNTVQGVVEKCLGRFVDEKKAQQLKDKSLPLEGCVFVAGRTDKGVTALQQVCSFYTWRKDVTKEDIKEAVNNAAPGTLSALHVSEVSRVFHPNFSAKWRRYLYIFPLSDGEVGRYNFSVTDAYGITQDANTIGNGRHANDDYKRNDDDLLAMANGADNENLDCILTKPRSFSISKVNEMLQQLEGKCLSYRVFARDTKASRSTGAPTECLIFHARAAEAVLPCTNQVDSGERVMCIELVANRFLRKMVRVIVATAIREAAAGADDDALVKLMGATCRRATAPPAPPEGLCLVDVGYGDFVQENCFIQN